MIELGPTPEGCIPCHCAVCLNDGKLTRTPATVITDAGYLLCDEHRDTDVATLIKAAAASGVAHSKGIRGA